MYDEITALQEFLWKAQEFNKNHGRQYPAIKAGIAKLIKSDIKPMLRSLNQELAKRMKAGFKRICNEKAGLGPAEAQDSRPDAKHYWIGHYDSGSRWDDICCIEVGDVLLTLPPAGNYMGMHPKAYKEYHVLGKAKWHTKQELGKYRNLIGWGCAAGETRTEFAPNVYLKWKEEKED